MYPSIPHQKKPPKRKSEPSLILHAQPLMSNSSDASGDGDSKEKAITMTAGYLVFSSIAISILKALIPLNKTRNETQTTNQSINESTQTIRLAQPFSPHEPITKVRIEYEALFTIISSISVVDLFWY
jgi:hypothetical protein